MHIIICGRQGVDYETDEETDELKAVGVKMKAEGETPYEPHILIRMEAIKPKKTNEIATIVAYAEKDRTGVLVRPQLPNPTFETLVAPLLGLLGDKQARMETGRERGDRRRGHRQAGQGARGAVGRSTCGSSPRASTLAQDAGRS
jgi:hypothetical protein